LLIVAAMGVVVSALAWHAKADGYDEAKA